MNEIKVFTKEESNRFNEVCYVVFNTEYGKELLKWLDMKFLKMPVAIPSESSQLAYFREGQNEIIRILKSGIIIHANNIRGNK